MTMLDRMRRHRGWLKWSLALVVLAFVVLYIPTLMPTDASLTSAGERLATIDSRNVSATEFRRRYTAQVNAYRQSYGGNLTDDLLRQMQVPQQVLQQIIQEKAEITEAERNGIRVSDAEVRTRIMSIPGLQENGHFIGEQRYRQLLRGLNPPVTTTEFEQSIRDELLLEKFRAGLTEWMSISDADLEGEYKRRNEKVTLDVVAVLADNFKNQVNPSDADIAAHFDKNAETYRVPDQRKIKFVRINPAELAAKIKIPREDVERAYNDKLGTYTTPEQIRASHVLISTEGRTDAEAKTRADEVLKEAKGGADFAALAKKYSDDKVSGAEGGDLDYFTRGRMVAEFDTAAFALAPGEISDPVKTQFGYHVIKLTDRKPAVVRPLSDPAVAGEIENQLLQQQMDAQATQQADALAAEATTPQALEKAAASRGLKVEESGLFPRGGLIEALGPNSPASTEAFELADNAVSPALVGPTGRVIFYVSGKQDSYLPKLDEVRTKVRDDLIQTRAAVLAKQKADSLATQLKSATNFQAAAKAAGLEAVTTQPIARDAVIPNIGRSPEIENVAFSLPVGSVSDAIATPQGAAIVRVVARPESSPADYAMAKDKFRAEVLNERRSRFYQTYMNKARERMKIDVDPEAFKRAIG